MAPRILIVDDNRSNLCLLESLLKLNAFEVMTAEHGEDALTKIRLRRPDLIVSDILMPVMDGYALCRALKSDDRFQHIPFIFYTATYTEPRDESFALSLGADRFILKPQSPEIVIDILTEVLNEKKALRATATNSPSGDIAFFRRHHEILFKKLEKKMSDLEKANQELSILAEQYRLSFENVMEVIYNINSDLKITSMSPSIEKILGYKPQDFIDRPVSDFGKIMTPGSWAQTAIDVQIVLNGKTITAAIYEFIARDGTMKMGEISCSPLICDGKVAGIVSVVRDVTERKRAEEEREKLLTDLQHALSQVKTLSGLLPICASCKKIRDDRGYWNHLELYIEAHSGAEFSHGLCPDCKKKLYPMLCRGK